MAGKLPSQRYNDGKTIGSQSNPLRPLQYDDLLIVDNTAETEQSEAMRVAMVGDLFKDLTSIEISGIHIIEITADDGRVHKLTFDKCLLVKYEII